MRTIKPHKFNIGQVVEFRPPVCGGVVIAVVTGLPNLNQINIRVTDGTLVYPTGSFATLSNGFVR